MLELRDWIGSSGFPQKPWLLLGKGPSFSRRNEFPLSDYNLLGLNNVAAEMKVDVAHLIDLDVVEACGERLLDNCDFLVMPRRPHVRFEPSKQLLEEHFGDLPVLRELDERGKLVWYNASTSHWPPVDGSPVIGVRYFSSEAALNILGEMGVKTVRSLGIDGGTGYSQEFSDLEDLTNTRPSFDAQFREMEDIIRERGMDYDPLVEPMRVFVGLDESQIVAARVLEHSIRKHASRPVRFIPMLDLPTPVPKDPKNRGRTGFSFSRFHIPKLAGYRGRALYLDADMQVFTDLAELWEIPFGDKKVLCTRQDEPPDEWKGSDWFKPGRQMSVMLLDCERLDWDIERIVGDLDEGKYTYEQLMFDLCVVDPDEIGDDVPPEWNHLEHYEPGVTKLLHYTVVPTQPWKNDENPLRELWMPDFREAKFAGIVKEEEVQRLARKDLIKRELAGLQPRGKASELLFKVLRKLQALLTRAEQRLPILRHPSLLRLRNRVGRSMGG
jgi:Glycosyl transferase family 8